MRGKKRRRISLFILAIVGIPMISSSFCFGESAFLSPPHRDFFDMQFRVHMNYFLSPKVITKSGLPLCAYQQGARARYGFSGPVEWGYAFQAWIAASQRQLASPYQISLQIQLALRTLQKLQIESNQSYYGLFYSSYTLTDWLNGDLDMPTCNSVKDIASEDNALLYASLMITKGWALQMGDTALASLATSVMQRMYFHHFLNIDQGGSFLSHSVNTLTGRCSPAKWNTYADAGGLINWIAYLSGSITFQEFKAINWPLLRETRIWQSCDNTRHMVRETPYFNSMSTWSLRPLAGFPLGSFESQGQITSFFCNDSFVPSIKAHLAYGDCIGVDYPAFSDATTQTDHSERLTGRFTPVNLNYEVPETTPNHCMPHAFFVPFNAGPDLDQTLLNTLVSLITQLMADQANYYHDSGPTPFGFEVLASPFKNDHYPGADNGRWIFETRSQAYTTLSLFNCLQLNEDKPTFFSMASAVPDYLNKVSKVMDYLYLPTLYTPNPVGPSITPVVGIYRFGSTGSAFPQEHTVSIDHDYLRTGENVLILEVTNNTYPTQWLIWDYLNLSTDTGELIWRLGDNESPPIDAYQAYDEFDNSLSFVSEFDVDHMPVRRFPRELNDANLPKVSIYFNLNGQESKRDLILVLDTVFAIHDEAPYCELKVSVNP